MFLKNVISGSRTFCRRYFYLTTKERIALFIIVSVFLVGLSAKVLYINGLKADDYNYELRQSN
jgi:hypothetical protein